MIKIIEELYNYLISNNIAKKDNIIGCTDEEIRLIEDKYNIRLPNIYKDFLKVFGHKAGNFFNGTDIFYNKIFTLKEYALDLLTELNINYELPNYFFVFSIHQGYQFMFFDLSSNNDDPPVYYFHEEMEKPEKKWNSFTDYLKVCMKDI